MSDEGPEDPSGSRAAEASGTGGVDVPEERRREVATRAGDAVAPSFEREPHPRSYGRPDRSFLRRALRAYVMGHDRGWEAERKLEAAAEEVEPRFADRFRPVPPPEAGAREDVAERTPGRPGTAADEAARASVRETSYGVPVPERLDFHRGPDTWRDRLGDAGRTGGPGPAGPAARLPEG